MKFAKTILAVTTLAVLAFGVFTHPQASAGITLPWDVDRDGCSNIEEAGGAAALGGSRDPANPWDFYDTPNASNVRDKVITVAGDILGVARRFGANDAGGTAPINRNSDPFTGPPPPAPAYHPAFDRGAQIGPNVWNRAGPDGFINVAGDILGVARQFGHNCAGEPVVDLASVLADCEGGTTSLQQAQSDVEAAEQKVLSVVSQYSVPDGDPSTWTRSQALQAQAQSQAMAVELEQLAASDPMIIAAGEESTQCFTVTDSNGQVIGVAKVTTSVSLGDGGAAGQSTKSYWQCKVTRKWESSPFNTDIAKMIHTKTWGYLSDPTNLWYGFITYNPLPVKENQIPSYFGFRFATVADSPPPSQWWYFEPYFMTSFAETKFEQGASLTSHWLQ